MAGESRCTAPTASTGSPGRTGARRSRNAHAGTRRTTATWSAIAVRGWSSWWARGRGRTTCWPIPARWRRCWPKRRCRRPSTTGATTRITIGPGGERCSPSTSSGFSLGDAPSGLDEHAVERPAEVCQVDLAVLSFTEGADVHSELALGHEVRNVLVLVHRPDATGAVVTQDVVPLPRGL